jgi:hypothetical protein
LIYFELDIRISSSFKTLVRQKFSGYNDVNGEVSYKFRWSEVKAGDGNYVCAYEYTVQGSTYRGRDTAFRLNVGGSLSCWEFTSVTFPYPGAATCNYDRLIEPCQASCIPQPGVVKHVSDDLTCPAVEGYVVPWFKINDGGAICMPVGAHTDIDPCVCGDVSNLPGSR